MLPELPAAQAQAVSHKLIDTYGKVIITWNPKDTLPVFPTQVEQVQHSFVVNSTITPFPHGGSPISGQLQPDFKILNESPIFLFYSYPNCNKSSNFQQVSKLHVV
jgi:hypothetical protein